MNKLLFLFPFFLFACGGSVAQPDLVGASDKQSSGGRSGSGSTPGVSGSRGQCDGRPECNPGDIKVAESCVSKDVDCYSQTSCGETIWCIPAPPTGCADIPTCPDDFELVKACIPDSECRAITGCGVTIICQKI